jgi:cytochrome bd-type quinol oxidase subunit 2
VLLATPLTGVPVAAAGSNPGHTLSAIDAVSLASLLFTLSAELTVLLFSIWLLFKITKDTVPEPEQL